MRRPILLTAAGVALLAGCAGDEPDRAVRGIELRPAGSVAKDAPRGTAVRTRAPRPAPAADGERARQSVEVPRIGSRAVGRPHQGRLVNGLQLPAAGPDWVTWDPILHRVPNRPWRRWGTDALLAFLMGVLSEYRAANPDAPKVLIGDLSRPRGGVFDRRYGGLGHASHQNGLDVDLYYPRRDRMPRAPRRVRDVDRRLAQDLVDRLIAAGVRFAFVGERVGLTGPAPTVQAIPHHDDHVHVRIHPPRRTAK